MQAENIIEIFDNIDFVKSVEITDLENKQVLKVESKESPERRVEVINSLERKYDIELIDNVPYELDSWSKEKNKYIYFNLGHRN